MNLNDDRIEYNLEVRYRIAFPDNGVLRDGGLEIEKRNFHTRKCLQIAAWLNDECVLCVEVEAVPDNFEAVLTFAEFRRIYDSRYLVRPRKNRRSLKERGEPDRAGELYEIFKAEYEKFREILFPSPMHEDLFTTGDDSYDYDDGSLA
jgi:hypothetical protein